MPCSICKRNGHNVLTCKIKGRQKKEIVVKKSNTKDAIECECSFVNKFNLCKNFQMRVLISLNIINNPGEFVEDEFVAKKCNKKNGYVSNCTDSWKNYKKDSKETVSSPKTDVVLCSSRKIVPISLKKGEGRLTSADFNETNAIYRSVLDENVSFSKDERLVSLVNKLLSIFPKDKYKSKMNVGEIRKSKEMNSEQVQVDKQWVSRMEKIINDMQDIWERIYLTYPEYVGSVIDEVASGSFKFGSNIGSAKYIIKYNKDYENDFETISDFRKLEIPKKVFGFKSSCGTIWIRFL
jgi:hypothetical protein